MNPRLHDTVPGARRSSAPPSSIAWAETSRRLQWFYVLGLIAIVISSRHSGWVQMAIGGSWLMSLLALTAMLVIAVAVGRAVQVLRRRDRLDAPVAAGWITLLRRAGLLLLALGIVTALLQLLMVPIVRAIVPRGSDNGIEFFIAGLALAAGSGFAPSGLLLFELSRLLGFELWHREHRE